MHWILANGKKTFWPSKNRLTESELKELVSSKANPQSNSEEWLTTKCKIMCTSRTYKGAVNRLKRLEKEYTVSSSQGDDDDDDDEKDDEANDSKENENLDNSPNSTLSGSSPLQQLLSERSSLSSEEPPAKKRKIDSHQTVASERKKAKASTPFRPEVNSISQNLFPASSSTPLRPNNFEHVVLKKLNEIYAVLEDLLSRGVRRDAVMVKSATSLVLPLSSVEDLLALDVELGDALKKKNMINFLCQFGGKNESEFVHRILGKLIQDKLCEKVNWTGLKRELAFVESKHIRSTLYSATRSYFETSTEASVEKIVKLWFNKYKDRLNPRTHSKKANDAPGVDIVQETG